MNWNEARVRRRAQTNGVVRELEICTRHETRANEGSCSRIGIMHASWDARKRRE